MLNRLTVIKRRDSESGDWSADIAFNGKPWAYAARGGVIHAHRNNVAPKTWPVEFRAASQAASRLRLRFLDIVAITSEGASLWDTALELRR